MFPSTLLDWYLVGTVMVPPLLAMRYFPRIKEIQFRATMVLTMFWLPFLVAVILVTLAGKNVDDL